MYRCFLDLEAWPAASVVKVDDTVPGLMEGRNAGCWTVAVVASGNEMGLTLAEWQALDDAERSTRRAAATTRLAAARPDFVIDSVADLLPLLARIEQRLRDGQRPAG
jgi:phosphonoacetaldehyde hydrolase